MTWIELLDGFGDWIGLAVITALVLNYLKGRR